jgi:hypothetical protein
VSKHRFHHGVDRNQKEIVEGLRKAGRYVLIINGDLDLIVGYQGRTHLLEVKHPDKKGKKGEFTERQKQIFKEWPGAYIHVVYTVEDALEATA